MDLPRMSGRSDATSSWRSAATSIWGRKPRPRHRRCARRRPRPSWRSPRERRWRSTRRPDRAIVARSRGRCSAASTARDGSCFSEDTSMSRLEDALRRAELANRQAKMKTEAEAAVKTPAVAAWSEPEAVTAPFAAAWSEPESAAAPPVVAAWSEPETVTAPFAVAGWSEPESAAAPPVVAAWSEPETVTAPLAVAAWSEPESAAAPPVVAGWSEPETVTAPFAVAGWSEPESATAPPAVAAWSELETVMAPFVVAAPSAPENVQPPLPPLPTWDFDGSVAAAELVEAPDEPKVVTPSDWKTYRFGAVASRKTIVDPDVESSLVEQYRRLAASLHHAQLQRNVRTVMITSAVAAEGKTLTATNLALTLSHPYKRRVLLIDADLRRPAVHEAF